MWKWIRFNSAILVVLGLALGSCSTSFYVVRHAEKMQTNTSDPALTDEGEDRAVRLAKILVNKNIQEIYSTNYIRTMFTAQPLAELRNIEIQKYAPKEQSELIEKLKISKKNTLIVGHSNTIKSIINGLAEKEVLAKDLEDSEYGHLYLIKRGKLGKPKFIQKEY
jgi:2,3-bisphosphoglycerate-dependent phosphoglycerate mutase